MFQTTNQNINLLFPSLDFSTLVHPEISASKSRLQLPIRSHSTGANKKNCPYNVGPPQ